MLCEDGGIVLFNRSGSGVKTEVLALELPLF